MGGSGGGSSTYPDYLQNIHEDWLARQQEGTPKDLIDMTMVEQMNLSLGLNPFMDITAVNPKSSFTRMQALLSTYKTETIDTLQIAAPTDEDIQREMDAFNTIQRRTFEMSTLPAYRAKMRDLGGIFSSFYVIGTAALEEGILQNSNKMLADLLLNRSNQAASWRQDCYRAFVHYSLEVERMKVASDIDFVSQQITVADIEAQWPLRVYQYGANMLASVSGGVVGQSQNVSTTRSAIGGAMSGMSLGAQVGKGISNGSGGDYSGWGTLIGGVLGAIGGAAS